ncbi:MAG: Coenzyme F420-dependent N10-methylene tetrahydromethanopterin reductase-like protein [Subtercola sp.]|nr:Coenzyme F420-dependent N10-methylene tetrahydromethanopterin reductase-like protein [Subtercola sp.]
MRIGIGLPFVDESITVHTAQSLGERAKLIENIGFDAAWMGDASFRRMSTWPDPLMWLLAAAQATEHIEVGTAVYQVPLRQTAVIAQRLLTIEALTPGRLLFGVGPGSTERAFDAVGGSFERRWKDFHAGTRVVREFADGQVVDGVDLAPPSEIKGGPKFLLGAWYGGKNLARAATEYDGWLCSSHGTGMDKMEDAIKQFRDLGGKRAIIATVGIDFHAVKNPGGESHGPGGADRFSLHCEPAEAADRVAWAASLGYDDIILHTRDHAHGERKTFDTDLYYDLLAEIYDVLKPAASLVATA